jgi:DNA mismatch repair protein MutL
VAHPQVAFRVLDSGRTIFQSPACEDLRDRIAEIWGRNLADDLISVDVSDPKTGYRLTGLTAKPGVGRSTRRELVTLVNRRPVDSRTLGYAVLDAYHGRIQKGRYPPAFLFLEIEPQEVDVNVHPAKREVRFRNDGAIRRFVLGAITDTLRVAAEAERPKAELTAPASENEVNSLPTSIPTGQPLPVPMTPRAARTTLTSTITGSQKLAESAKVNTPSWRLISILKGQYGLFDTPRGLVMLHLRYADQRVRFGRILKSYKESTPPSQRLLIPHTVELEPLASEALLAHLDLINKQGFQVEKFGRHFYRIEALPAWLEPEQAEVFIRDMVDLLRQRGGSRKESELIWESVAKLAVKGSYRRRDNLSETAVQQLAEALLDSETPHTSPFGKPTFSEISWSEWERRFGNE